MYIDITVQTQNCSTEQKQAQRLQEVGAYLEQEFPANGTPRSVEIADELPDTIFVNQCGPLTTEQAQWLNTSSEVRMWTCGRGGFLTLPATHLSVESNFPCRYTYYKDETQRALVDVSRYVAWLHTNIDSCLQVASEADLFRHLADASIPQSTGWEYTVRLCERCDQPGAMEGFLCRTCSEAREHRREQTTTDLRVGLLLSAVVLLLARLWRQRIS